MFNSFLRDNREAEKWVECYPIGNGNIGVMDYQGAERELMQLNNDTFWSGYGALKHNKTCTKEIMDNIRKLTLENNKKQAETLIAEHILGGWTESYLPAGDLILHNKINGFTDYVRKLDMNTAILSANWKTEGKTVEIESFVSFPDGVFVKNIKTQKTQTSNLTFAFPDELKGKISSQANTLYLEILAPSQTDPIYHGTDNPIHYDEKNKGVNLLSAVKLITDGKLVFSQNSIDIEGYTSLTIIYTSKTSYLFDGDLREYCDKTLASAEKKGYDMLRKAHIDDYQKLYGRVSLTLNGKTDSPSLTEKSMIDFKKNPDDSLIITLFDFGRYLTIAGSRTGTQATNLQGIWNNIVRPPWSSNYTTNINTEMNYFGTDLVNLSECIEPLFTLLKKCYVAGSMVAKETFHMRGWLLAHNADLWGHATPVGHQAGAGACVFGLFIGGSGWILHHLVDHCLFADDKQMLTELLPYLSGACQFYLDYLSKDNNGDLVPNPSASPENSFHYRFGSCATNTASTMELSIIRTTFLTYLKAVEIVGETVQDEKEILSALKNLKGYHINKHGGIAEWDKSYREIDPRHRHVSHLYGLHPQYEITPEKTPYLAKAAARTLKRRGLGGTGWSLAWKINMFARLKDGETAYTLIKNQLRYIPAGDKIVMRGGGSYSSLLCAHPPFQIDGNYGAMSGIGEMLVQSHGDAIELLPAIPSAWKDGSVQGLKARGNYVVNITWANGKVTDYSVSSQNGKKGVVKVKVNGKIIDVVLK